MASNKHDKAIANANDSAGDIPEFRRPEGLISLVQRYAQYDPIIDARDRRNVGTRAAPLHGLLIGARELPATIPDPVTGELRPWQVLVIELLQPAPVRDQVKPGQSVTEARRMARPPEHIIITSSTAINSIRERYGLDVAMLDPDRVYEIYLEPEVSQTKKGLSLWVFPVFEMGKPRTRSVMQQLNPFSEIAREMALKGARTVPALGAMPGNGSLGAATAAAAAPAPIANTPV